MTKHEIAPEHNKILLLLSVCVQFWCVLLLFFPTSLCGLNIYIKKQSVHPLNENCHIIERYTRATQYNLNEHLIVFTRVKSLLKIFIDLVILPKLLFFLIICHFAEK